MKQLYPTISVIPIDGGFCIERQFGTCIEYVGLDGLWVRDPKNITTPMNEGFANEVKQQMEGGE